MWKKNDKRYLFSSFVLTFYLEDDLRYDQKYHFWRGRIHFSWITCFVCWNMTIRSLDMSVFLRRQYCAKWMAKFKMAAGNIQNGQLGRVFFVETLWNLVWYMSSYALITIHEIWGKNGVYVIRYVKKMIKSSYFRHWPWPWRWPWIWTKISFSKRTHSF